MTTIQADVALPEKKQQREKRNLSAIDAELNQLQAELAALEDLHRIKIRWLVIRESYQQGVENGVALIQGGPGSVTVWAWNGLSGSGFRLGWFLSTRFFFILVQSQHRCSG